MSQPPDVTPPLPRLAPRKPASHKGDFGRAVLIGGSSGMTGAIALAGMAALRSGAGLVKLAVPSNCQNVVAGFDPCYMTIALPSDEHGRIASWAVPLIAEATAEATAVACGPGLGRSEELIEVVGWLYRSLPQPLIVDADGLYALAHKSEVLGESAGPRILTPHPGEFARLIGREEFLPEERDSLARELARRAGAVVVLKGHRTVITDGDQVAINPTGNPGMATGGTGDVLTGIITALVCQKLAPYDAARLGVYVHGLAGDLATAELGQVALVASDLIEYLPEAWRAVE